MFRERIVTCFIDDTFGVESRDKLNIDMITWECDYPHSDSIVADRSGDRSAEYLDGVRSASSRRSRTRTLLRMFTFDPFTPRPARARDRRRRCAPRRPMSTSAFRSSARLKKEGTSPVTVLDLASALPK